jgi:hypothetical protein
MDDFGQYILDKLFGNTAYVTNLKKLFHDS